MNNQSKMQKLLCMAVCFFCIGIMNAFAQEQKVTVELKNATLRQVFKSIERQTTYRFSYRNTLVDDKSDITISKRQVEVSVVLDEALKGRNLTYTIVSSKSIVISNPEEQIIPHKNKRISGTVKSANGESIIGANIKVTGTTIGCITDIDGNFTLEVPENAKLTISYIGFQTQEITLNGKSSVNIILKEDAEMLDEVVVIGYGVIKKKDLTGSVGRISSGSIKELKVSHPTQAMAGQLAGVQVQQTGGSPGEAATIRVRGTGSISASSSPLYVVDGFPLGEQNLNSVNPNDIESIEVLKDASAAAIYGSRASNGVVLITTKSGKTGKVKINLDAYWGFQNVTKKMDMLNVEEFLEFSREAFNNNYVDRVPGASPDDPVEMRPSGNRFRYPSFYDDPEAIKAIGKGTDWQDEIFRTAPIQSYQVSVSGGSEKTKYMFSAGYFNQKGIIIGSDYKRFSARAKIESEFNRWLKVGINLAPTYIDQDRVNEGHWTGDGVVIPALATTPLIPVYNPDGTWASQAQYAVAGDGLTGVPNAVAIATDIENKRNNLRFFGNMFAEISILKNLKFKTTFGVDMMNYRSKFFRPSNVPKGGTVAPLPSTDRKGNTENREVLNWLNENTLSYFTSFGAHEIDAVAGITFQKNTYNQSKVEGSDFPDDIIHTLNNAKVKTGSSDMDEWSLISYLARVNYRYDNKYYITASIRADGSSCFGKNNRYGYFPSGSLAWRISQEDFMKDIQWISDLKIRTSVGLTGNNSMSDHYASIGTMSNANYVFGLGTGNVVTGSAQDSFSNHDLTWEKTLQYDLGFEFSILKSRLSFVLDLYKRKTTDLLLNVDIPTITGFSKAWRNIGKVNNKGIEFTINSVNIMNKNFSWTTNLNISANRNKVIELGPSGDPIQSDGGAGTTHITMIGEPMGNFYGYKQIGVYMNQADLDSSPHLADSHVGDAKYADIDKNGVIDANDRTIIGNNEPRFSWGMTNQLRYKNFDFSIMLQGVHGREVLFLGKRFFTQLEGNMNQMREVLYRWRSEEEPGDGKTPRANALTTGQNNAVSTRWVEDGSFVRINNLTVGYTLPETFIHKCQMQDARVYLSVQNLATFTSYSGFNPETSFKQDSALAPGTDYGMYPLNRTFTIGVNVTF